MDTPKEMIVAALAKFGEIKSIKIQLIGMWQKAVVEFAELDQTKCLAIKWSFLINKNSIHMAITVKDHNTWASRNQFRALLFTLLMRTTAHDLGTLLDKVGEKTCIINYSLNSGNWVCYAVVGFESEENLESVYHTKPIYGGVKLFWARLNLVHYENCGHFSHSTVECNVLIVSGIRSSKSVKRVASEEHHLQLAKLYAKKGVPISCLAVFGSRSWVQVVLLASSSDDSLFGLGSGSRFSSLGILHNKGSTLVDHVDSSINNHLTSLECSLKLLADQVSNILCRLNGMELVSLMSASNIRLPISSASVKLVLDADIVLNVLQLSLFPLFLVVKGKTVNLGLSSSKVWLAIDEVEASKINSMILTSVSSMDLIKHLSVIRKKYHKFKYCKSKIAKDTTIRKTIDQHMERFCSNKERMIKSVLKCLFYKIVLDHLVVNDELVFEPNEIKLKIDEIMEGWTKK
ncbi:hypothetical protein G9A89_020603 [Geosiphon pyriformis]|nr:hypothetical protein G9A89_020603 [Geosiphon pyriformis]